MPCPHPTSRTLGNTLIGKAVGNVFVDIANKPDFRLAKVVARKRSGFES